MSDDRDVDARSRNMSAVKSKNSAPERAVRSALHRLGYRFRLHVKELPGKPDVVLPRYKTCIFVNGCFWHKHNGCKRASVPHSNSEFWEQKLTRNIERDNISKEKLESLGWKVCVIWSCEVKDSVKLVQILKNCLET